jgi:hypothetical protein
MLPGVVDVPHARALPGCGASVRVVDRGEPVGPVGEPVIVAAATMIVVNCP